MPANIIFVNPLLTANNSSIDATTTTNIGTVPTAIVTAEVVTVTFPVTKDLYRLR